MVVISGAVPTQHHNSKNARTGRRTGWNAMNILWGRKQLAFPQAAVIALAAVLAVTALPGRATAFTLRLVDDQTALSHAPSGGARGASKLRLLDDGGGSGNGNLIVGQVSASLATSVIGTLVVGLGLFYVMTGGESGHQVTNTQIGVGVAVLALGVPALTSAVVMWMAGSSNFGRIYLWSAAVRSVSYLLAILMPDSSAGWPVLFGILGGSVVEALVANDILGAGGDEPSRAAAPKAGIRPIFRPEAGVARLASGESRAVDDRIELQLLIPSIGKPIRRQRAVMGKLALHDAVTTHVHGRMVMHRFAVYLVSFVVVQSVLGCEELPPEREPAHPSPAGKTASDYVGNYAGTVEIRKDNQGFSGTSVMQLAADAADVVVWADVADLIADIIDAPATCAAARFKLSTGGGSGSQVATITCHDLNQGNEIVLTNGTLALVASGGIRLSISFADRDQQFLTWTFTGQKDASALYCNSVHQTGRCTEIQDDAKTCIAGTCCDSTRVCGTACCQADWECFASGQCIPPCGQSPNGWCDAGASCVDGSCCDSASICGTSCCNNGETCSAGQCKPPDTRKPFGAKCVQDDECLTNVCNGGSYCSEACTRSSTCAAESANPIYWCVNNGNVNFCERSCNSTSDCAVLGAEWSCNNHVDIEGLVHGFCGVYTDYDEGWECKDNAQCTSRSCNGYWCSGPCANDDACGNYAWCLLTSNQSYRCFPFCANDTDCAIFGPGLTCKDTTTRDGTAAKVCGG